MTREINKEKLIQIADEIKELLRPKSCTNPQRLQELHDDYSHIPVIKDLFSKDYDRRVTNPGWGSKNCSCHISPPCQSCVDVTNGMSEEELDIHLKSLKSN